MFERFTDRARRVLVLAQEEARLLNHNFIGTEHILLGLISEGDGVAAKALQSLGIALESVRDRVQETIGPASGPPSGASPPFTPRAKKVLELSLREALQLGHNYIGTEHMLLGLVREGEGVATQVLVTLGAELSAVRQEVIQVLAGHAVEASAATVSLLSDRIAAIDPDAVTITELPIDPNALVRWGDVEAVLHDEPVIDGSSTTERQVSSLTYRSCTYRPRPLPSVTVSVAGAHVTREAFDGFHSGIGMDEEVEGLGDAATFNADTGSLRVLKGSTLFVVSVYGGRNDLRAAAVALARKALDRLGDGPSPPAGSEA